MKRSLDIELFGGKNVSWFKAYGIVACKRHEDSG